MRSSIRSHSFFGGELRVFHQDNLGFLKQRESESYHLAYIDPPFNTGRRQKRGNLSYEDSFKDLCTFLEPRLLEAKRVLTETGSLFVHLDWREVHYVKVLLDQIFGRENFKNEIIWAYDYGARSKTRWSSKHDSILWYTKDTNRYTFNYACMDRIPYMAPGLVGPEKAARGKTPTDVWWHTIVSPNGKEKTGYPTQKPLGILERIVNVHSNPGERLIDFFAGSGSFGEAAFCNGRWCDLVDQNEEAVDVMVKRFESRFTQVQAAG